MINATRVRIIQLALSTISTLVSWERKASLRAELQLRRIFENGRSLIQQDQTLNSGKQSSNDMILRSKRRDGPKHEYGPELSESYLYLGAEFKPCIKSSEDLRLPLNGSNEACSKNSKMSSDILYKYTSVGQYDVLRSSREK
ncbi:uncharacterized protein RAG0_01565 [Rhynchosporium agropyri]|uniref:Uncharacterized protein n=1 Tax=Rhynchosporium agropyri TaxID=914238 RepID=A0A1E1JXQ6_9HELO|nr:uncharacterized protein RAG0_01565 [Rhynchosporium agropyri]